MLTPFNTISLLLAQITINTSVKLPPERQQLVNTA